MKLDSHCRVVGRIARRGAARLAALALLVFVGFGTAYAATGTTETSSAVTCASGTATTTGMTGCPAITTTASYNSAQSDPGTVLGPLDPWGPNNLPSTGSPDQAMYVINNSTASSPVSFFVPFASQQEWDNFYNNAPANIKNASGTPISIVDTAARPITSANVAANPATYASTMAVVACGAPGSNPNCATVPGVQVCHSPSPSSYFAQPSNPTSNGIAGYSRTHLIGNTGYFQTGTASMGLPATGSGATTAYPGLNADGTFSASPVPMTFTCQGGAGTWTQTATVSYIAGDSSSQAISWNTPSINYRDNVPAIACGTASGPAVTAAPTTNLCPTGATVVTPPGVAGSGPWTWSCLDNTSGATSPTCTAPLAGSCQTPPNGGTYANAAAVPTPLCATGTATPATLADPGPWTWTCSGSTGTTPAPCSAALTVATATSGVCGITPGTCTSGTASAVDYSGDGYVGGPAPVSAFWYCWSGVDSTSGGTVAPCETFATSLWQWPNATQDVILNSNGTQDVEALPPNVGSGDSGYSYNAGDDFNIMMNSQLVYCPNSSCQIGECGNTLFQCLSGSPSWYDEANGIWECSGNNGGQSNQYCTVPPVVNGVCGPTMDTCAAGMFLPQQVTVTTPVDGSTASMYDVLDSIPYYGEDMGVVAGYVAIYWTGGPGTYVMKETSTGPCTPPPGETQSDCGWDNETNVAGWSSAPQSQYLQWQCVGINGGTNATCSKPTGTINGQCGSWSGGLPAAGGFGTCTIGTYAYVGFDGNTATWTCAGNPGGTTNTCTSELVGKCQTSPLYSAGECIYGESEDPGPSCGGSSGPTGGPTSNYTWSCVGAVSTDSCSEACPP